MKKPILILLLGLISSLHLLAIKKEGKIFYENDTIDVIFEIPLRLFSQEPNYKNMQYKMQYYDSLGNKIVLKPEQAKEIRFYYENAEVRMLSRKNTLRIEDIYSLKSNIFLKLEIDGALKLFKYYTTNSVPGTYNTSAGTIIGSHTRNVENYLLQKYNEELKRPKSMSFRNDMVEYFKDCPNLSRKIDNKELGKNDLQAIVNYYNSDCMK